MSGTQREKDVSRQSSALVLSLLHDYAFKWIYFPQCLIWIGTGGRVVSRSVSRHPRPWKWIDVFKSHAGKPCRTTFFFSFLIFIYLFTSGRETPTLSYASPGGWCGGGTGDGAGGRKAFLFFFFLVASVNYSWSSTDLVQGKRFLVHYSLMSSGTLHLFFFFF